MRPADLLSVDVSDPRRMSLSKHLGDVASFCSFDFSPPADVCTFNSFAAYN
jgi:hypothetical protein